MRKARPETKASCDKWLEDRDLLKLSKDDPARVKAVAEWGKWYMRQPDPGNVFLKTVSERDPIRQGVPKGWKGVI